jgi:hypothetical protein
LAKEIASLAGLPAGHPLFRLQPTGSRAQRSDLGSSSVSKCPYTTTDPSRLIDGFADAPSLQGQSQSVTPIARSLVPTHFAPCARVFPD